MTRNGNDEIGRVPMPWRLHAVHAVGLPRAHAPGSSRKARPTAGRSLEPGSSRPGEPCATIARGCSAGQEQMAQVTPGLRGCTCHGVRLSEAAKAHLCVQVDLNRAL